LNAQGAAHGILQPSSVKEHFCHRLKLCRLEISL
jgi:hypothetical protein